METKTFDLSSTYTLTPAQVEQYHKDGHIVLRGVATREEIDHIRLLIMDVVEGIAEKTSHAGPKHDDREESRGHHERCGP